MSYPPSFEALYPQDFWPFSSHLRWGVEVEKMKWLSPVLVPSRAVIHLCDFDDDSRVPHQTYSLSRWSFIDAA